MVEIAGGILLAALVLFLLWLGIEANINHDKKMVAFSSVCAFVVIFGMMLSRACE